MGGHECEDGSLGCFVTQVIANGPADQNNIEVGDQILEFNGYSTIDSTYEEVRTLQNNCCDYIQLVVQHNNIRLVNGDSTPNKNLATSRFYQTVPRLCQSSQRKRRNLPLLPAAKPTTPKDEKKEEGFVLAETLEVPIIQNVLKPILINRGRLLMQLWNDCKQLKLAVTINQACNLPSENSETWHTFAIGRVIFDERPVQNILTKAMPGSNPVWNETYIFEYGTEVIEDAVIEIYLHETNKLDDLRVLKDNFVGMIILPLMEANLDDEPRWYELTDKPMRKISYASVTFKSSSSESINKFVKTNSLPKKKRFNSSMLSNLILLDIVVYQFILKILWLLAFRNKRHSISAMQSTNYQSGSQSSKMNILTPVRKLSKVFSKFFKARGNSETQLKQNILTFDENEEVSSHSNLRRHTG